MISYYDTSVLQEATKRIEYVFDNFENIVCSVSSGKDSSVLFYLALKEARKRKRKLTLFFLDQEIEYSTTIELIESMMQIKEIIPAWFQVPIYMTNSTTYFENLMYCWEPNKKWLRDKSKYSIHSIEKDYPKRFYDFFTWYETQQKGKTAFLVGLRSKESLDRFRAVTKNPGYNNVLWSTKTKSENVFRFYPIYDWMFGDIWKYIDDNNISYNKLYDYMYLKSGTNIRTMRVSNLIHEKSFRCLESIQEFEPDLYNKLLERVPGVHCAARYSRENTIYDNVQLPPDFKTYKEYRDHLLQTLPKTNRERFLKLFKKHKTTEHVHKQHVKKILINDLENNIPMKQKKDTAAIIEKWKKIL